MGIRGHDNAHVKEFCNTITRAKIFGDFGAPKRVKCVRTNSERTPRNKTVNIIEQKGDFYGWM